MNEQTKLSPEDAARLAALQFRGELLKRDAQIHQLELRLFQAHVLQAYGNPWEAIEIGDDGELKRTPVEKPSEG